MKFILVFGIIIFLIYDIIQLKSNILVYSNKLKSKILLKNKYEHDGLENEIKEEKKTNLKIKKALIPYIPSYQTYKDNNPLLDYIIFENKRLFSDKTRDSNLIPSIYTPEEMTYQETDNYVVSQL